MATQCRQRGRSAERHLKLKVARFLDLHAAQGGIDYPAYKIAYRMIEMISAMGQDVHIIIQSKIPHITIVNRVAGVAAGVLEGCEVFRQHFGERLMSVQDIAQELPMLDSLRVEALEEIMPVYAKTLKKLHVPTGNDARLFDLMVDHYNNMVFCDFTDLLIHKSQTPVYSLHIKITAIRHALGAIRATCAKADELVAKLDIEFEEASERLSRNTSLQLKFDGQVHASTSESQAMRSDDNDGPPEIPPLPFQFHHDDESFLSTMDSDKVLALTKSFSVVEDQVARRGHFRDKTLETGSIDLAHPPIISQGAEPSLSCAQYGQPSRVSKTSIRRGRSRTSSSSVPRIFTGTLNELENKVYALNIHKIETPEGAQSPSTADISPSNCPSPVKARDFADDIGSLPVDPKPSLQRVETLVGREVQWEDRIVNGQLLRSRRPSEKLQSAHTVAENTEEFCCWLSQQSPGFSREKPMPNTPDAASKHVRMHQRERTF